MSESKPVRRCQVCEHASVLGINQAITNGKSFRRIAEDYRIGSERSGEFRPDHKKVIRHAEGCMETSYQQVQEKNLAAQGQAIHARMQFLDEKVDQAIADALEGEVVMMGDVPMTDPKTGDILYRRTISHTRALLAAVREGRQNAALTAKLAGAMPDENADALERARAGLEDPAVRALVLQVEELLAAQAEAAGQNILET